MARQGYDRSAAPLERFFIMKLFPTTLIGSFPRTDAVLTARRKLNRGALDQSEFNALIEKETRRIVTLQEQHGLDVVVSGELHRDNYVSFVSEHVNGVRQMSMADMMDYVDDKEAFETILKTLDVPSTSIKNAICTGKIAMHGSLVLDELKRLKRYATRPVKITLPGPYLLTRSMWLKNVSSKAYGSKEDLARDVISLYKAEIEILQNEGVDVIQFDEPVLTEVVFTEGKPRTFMCAALSERKDPREELAFATDILQPVIAAVDRSKSVAALHVCRGNWSKNEAILLEGPYTPLIELFSKVNPMQLALEFSTPRAKDLTAFLKDERIGNRFILGLGVQNPRLDRIETIESIVKRVEEALSVLSPDHIWLNPDCGFATFANRPVNEETIIAQKIDALAKSAELLRQRYGS